MAVGTQKRVRRTATTVAVALLTATALTACGPPAQKPLTAEQCEAFADARWTLDVYTADAWAPFQDGHGVRVISGVQRAVGDLIDAAEELGTAETKDAVDAVVQAGYGYTLLASDYLDDPPVAGDPDDLAEQAAVREALDEALASCG
jgi:hypothetical protein